MCKIKMPKSGAKQQNRCLLVRLSVSNERSLVCAWQVQNNSSLICIEESPVTVSIKLFSQLNVQYNNK